jgi:Holliday junction resolvasome RuvABC endonuclease subunit
VIALGVDYSTKKCAVSVLSPSGGLVRSVQLPRRSTDMLRNLEQVWAFFEEMAVDAAAGLSGQPCMVAVESPIVGGSGAASTAIGMSMACGGIVRAAQSLFGADCVGLVYPASWKKQVCGKGSLDKEQVSAWLLQHRPDLYQLCANDDEVDATCLSLWALSRVPVP